MNGIFCLTIFGVLLFIILSFSTLNPKSDNGYNIALDNSTVLSVVAPPWFAVALFIAMKSLY